jgi:hypothetical protein
MVGTSSMPRTRLEQVVGQRRWTIREFCEDFSTASRKLDRQVTVSPRQASRWMSGRVGKLPYPSSCRVLEYMFKEPAERLFGPPHDLPHRSATVSQPGEHEDIASTIERDIALAADESARFGQFVEQSNIGPHALEQLRADLARISETYPHRPLYPTFIDLRNLRDRVFTTLEGRQPPALARELYLAASVLCGMLANASFDLGWLAAAETQARTAFLCAEFAGHNGLRAWIRGTQSLIAYWEDRNRDAVELARDGRRYPAETGTAQVRLAAIEGRAHGRLRDKRAAEQAFCRAQKAREQIVDADQPGGILEFPTAKQALYAATMRLWLGRHTDIVRATQHATEAVELYQLAPSGRQRTGELCLARLDLALAQLHQLDLESAAEQIREVLAAARRRRTESILRRLRQVASDLQRPRFQTATLALNLQEEIRVFRATPAATAERALFG